MSHPSQVMAKFWDTFHEHGIEGAIKELPVSDKNCALEEHFHMVQQRRFQGGAKVGALVFLPPKSFEDWLSESMVCKVGVLHLANLNVPNMTLPVAAKSAVGFFGKWVQSVQQIPRIGRSCADVGAAIQTIAACAVVGGVAPRRLGANNRHGPPWLRIHWGYIATTGVLWAFG